MKIKFIEHAKERMQERGASEEEIKKVLSLGEEISAKKRGESQRDDFQL